MNQTDARTRAVAYRGAAGVLNAARDLADAQYRAAIHPLIAQTLQEFVREHEHVTALTLTAEYDTDHGRYFRVLSGGATISDAAPAKATGEDEALELFDDLQRDVLPDVLLELFSIDDIGDGRLTRAQIDALHSERPGGPGVAGSQLGECANAVVTIVVPLDDLDRAAPAYAKQEASAELLSLVADRLLEHLPNAVFAGRWETAQADDAGPTGGEPGGQLDATSLITDPQTLPGDTQGIVTAGNADAATARDDDERDARR